jgi:hypothetical protein
MNAIVPHQVSDLERIARAFAASKLFGVQNVDQALALCLIAQAEGRHPATAAQDYNIIQGRPSKKADAMLRDFLAGGGKVEWHKLSDVVADATFSHPAGGSVRIEWTMDRAQRAGVKTAMYAKYPRQMLRSRCVSEGVRTVFPMATSGMYVPEEAQDIGPATVVAEDAPSQPTAPPSTAIAQYEADLAKPNVDDRGVKRATSAEAKRIGLGERIGKMLWDCESEAAVDAFERNFDTITAQCPRGWLDSIRTDIILKREDLAKASDEDRYGAEFDAAFSGTVGPKVTEDT